MAKSVREIAADFNRSLADSTDDETPRNINTGTLHGGQHIRTVTVSGDYVPGNKKGKKEKK